jgi:hypothetical protein
MLKDMRDVYGRPHDSSSERRHETRLPLTRNYGCTMVLCAQCQKTYMGNAHLKFVTPARRHDDPDQLLSNA